MNRVTDDFSGAIVSLLSLAQSWMGAKASERMLEIGAASLVMSGWLTARVRSSAYDVIIWGEIGELLRK